MAKIHISTVLERIYRFGMIKYFPKGKFIVRHEEAFQYLFLIIDGKAKVIPSSLTGVDSLIDYLEPGDFIGDIEYYGETYYIHSVQAIDDCEVLMIPISRFNLLLDDTTFSKFYIDNLTKKLYVASNKSKYLTTLSAKDRFIQHIENESKNGVFHIDYTLAELAKQLGITSRHLRRVMNDLKENDVITTDKSNIYLKEKKTIY